MPIDPKLLQQASKTASLGDDVTPALKFLAPTVAGAGIGAIPGAALGAAYNGLFGKPEHFYDDIGRGTLRGALTGGGAGLGMSVGSEIGGDDIGTRLGGRVGGLTGHLLGKYLVARPEEEDEGLRIETRRTRSRKAQKKEAKVYEAAESVDGMKPKEVYESHKKCTPGEFGMNKEGEDANPSVQPIPRPYNPGNNAALQAALAVALPVAGAAGGVGLGGLGGGVLGAVHGAVSPGEYPEQDEEGNVQMRRRNRLLGALRGGGAGVLMGAGVGGLGGGALGAYTARKRIAELSKQSAAAHTTNNERVSLMTKQSAFEFGAHVKQALGPVGYGAAGGGLIGAGLGGLLGAVVPGTEVDEDGRVRRKSRLGAALAGAAGGGLLGAGGGAALGHYSPNTVNSINDFLQSLMGGRRPKPAAPSAVVAKHTMDPKLMETANMTPNTMRPGALPEPRVPQAKMPAGANDGYQLLKPPNGGISTNTTMYGMQY